MTIFYNISFLTFLVDCSFSAMPTKFGMGGKNSLNPAKNLSEGSELCPSQKLPSVGKIL